MSVYQLIFGNFPFVWGRMFGMSFLEGYYPFFLYRGKYASIPDASGTGGQPFGKIHLTDNEMFETKEEPQSYLFNDSMLGRKLQGRQILSDSIFYTKLFFFSYDMVTTQKYQPQYKQIEPFCELFFHDKNGSQIFRIKIIKSINLTQSTFYSGSLIYTFEVYHNDVLLISQPISIDVKLSGVTGQVSVVNRDELVANDFEKSIKMKVLLSKQILLLRVRIFGIYLRLYDNKSDN